ncbi:protein VASCULAR ASSOCIATED DEATH 1, chloroplastic isoform X2 [Cryptomeria japonica]|uniref:protein VASCULAR ASSOCIATED DEATH 1, chloroplastic isoform X2 n=1 Tax=Cryptomeria japonica TaxID=3369 RepID=UPI0025ABCE3B|nr:protein VASCULAR ASSOCIATED DEATH 1, chloroplastic isoform X2 [Cryptomeria japonica]
METMDPLPSPKLSPLNNNPNSSSAEEFPSMELGTRENENAMGEICEGADLSLPLQLPQTPKAIDYFQPASRSEEYRQLFHLPPEEVLVRDFNCAVQKNILLQGHMYLFVRYVCFYSNIFGYEKKVHSKNKIIPLRDITSVEKARTAGIFPNAIEIVAWGKKHFFGSFLSRDEAYRLIVDGWMQHSEHAKSFLNSQDTPIIPNGPDGTLCAQLEESETPLLITYPNMDFVGRDLEETPPEIEESSNEIVTEDGVCNVVNEKISENSVTNKLEDSTAEKVSPDVCTSIWQVEDMYAPKVPEQFKMVGESKFPIDVKEFFQLFFSNDATSFAQNFHRKCGDEDFQCTPWNEDKHFGHVRDASFRHPIKFYFGSRFTHCQEVQRFRVYKNSHLVVETSQQMNDIPYGDYFRVEGLWDVEWTSDENNTQCILRIYVNVAFSKKTFWKGKIEQGTSEECKEAYASWIHEAHSLLNQVKGDSIKTVNCEPPFTSTPNSPPSPKVVLSADGNGQPAIPEQGQSDNTIAKACNIAEDATTRHHFGNLETESLQESNFKLSNAQRSMETLLAKTFSYRSSPLLSNVYTNLTLHWKPGGQFTLILALILIAIFAVTQIAIIIMLVRYPTAQYVSSVSQKPPEYTGQSLQKSNSVEVAAWLERRVYYLEEEVSMMEARFKSIHHEFVLLKRHLQTVNRFNSKAQPD